MLHTKKATKAALKDFTDKWNCEYSYVLKSWEDNWKDLTIFFEFPVEIIKIIYTTNLIKNLNIKIH